MAMVTTLLGYIVPILTALPNLILGVEALWSNKPKSGASKWISVEQATSGTIQLAAQEVAKLAPAGTPEQTISDAVAVFTKSVNDAFVTLMNTLGILPTGGTSGKA